MFKKIGLIALGVVIVIGLVAGVLYQRKVLKAELTQAVLIERAARLRDFDALQKKYDQLGEISTIKITELDKTVAEKDKASQAIVVKKDSEIRAIRNMALDWQGKYNLLEPETLQLSAKVTALEGVIEPLKLANAELKARDLVRVENITALTGKLNECQVLLDKSIANTASVLKKGWVLKIFDRLSIVAGAGIGADGKVRPVIAGGIRIL